MNNDDLNQDEINQRSTDEKKAKNQRANELNDLRLVMETEPGRRVVWRLLENAGVFHSTYTGDALSGAFAEGKRNSGLQLFIDAMEACPDLYLSMAREARKSEDESDAV